MNRNLCRTKSNGAAAYKHRNASSPYASEGGYGKMHRHVFLIVINILVIIVVKSINKVLG